MAQVKLENVIVRANTKVDKDDTDLVYYVGGEHFESGNITVEQKGLIAGSTIGPMFYYGFKAGQFLLVSRNPHLKKAGVVDFDGICSEKTFVLETANSEILLPEYLPFVLQNEKFWDYAVEHKHGSTNFFINWSTLANYEFNLPSIEEQKRIADIAWAAHDLKKSYKEQINAIDNLVKSQFIEMLSDVTEYRKISDLTEVVTGGTPSTAKDEYWENGDIAWLQSGCCQDCEVSQASKYITQKGYDNSAAKMMPPETVMIALTGATAGKIGYLTIKACGNQSITGILPCETIKPRFLYHFLMTQRGKILKDCVGAAQPHISQGYVKNYNIPVLPLKKQETFVAFAEQSDKSKLIAKQIRRNQYVYRSRF